MCSCPIEGFATWQSQENCALSRYYKLCNATSVATGVGAHRSTDCASYRDTHVPSELFSGQCDTAHKNPTKLTYTKHNYKARSQRHLYTLTTHTHTRSHANHTRCLLNHSLIHVHTCSLIPNKACNTSLTVEIIVLMEYTAMNSHLSYKSGTHPLPNNKSI